MKMSKILISPLMWIFVIYVLEWTKKIILLNPFCINDAESSLGVNISAEIINWIQARETVISVVTLQTFERPGK